jgi:phosphotransferase system HPr-like phosphotransfer protein
MPNIKLQSLQTQRNNRVKIECQTLNQQSLQTQQNNRVKIECRT